MGQEYSSPQPGAPFLVIGAGLPRTGTSSFSLALSILLDGPVYHGGTQVTQGPEVHIKTWIRVLTQYLNPTATTRADNLRLIKERMDGYVGCVDIPLTGLVPELLELYPDALVIATTRDKESWVKSMNVVAGTATQTFLGFATYLLPGVRWFPAYVEVCRPFWVKLWGEDMPLSVKSFDCHRAWLEEVVPKDRLVWYDVRDGWGPLCKALGKPVPDVEFPRVNDSQAIDEFAKKTVMRGLGRWMAVGGGVAAVVMAYRWR